MVMSEDVVEYRKKFLRRISDSTEVDISGGSRNLERGVQLRIREAHPKIFGLPRPLPDVNAHVIIVTTIDNIVPTIVETILSMSLLTGS